MTAKAALSRVSGVSYELKDVIVVRLQDKPGELAKLTKRLARAAINVDSIYILGRDGANTVIAFTVDNVQKAESALK